jgi:hypothetical protein
MSRWPEPVREPLPVGILTEQDIDDALRLTVQYMTEPEDPSHDWTTFAALGASRAALIECAEALSMARIDRELHGRDVDHREWERIGQEYVARKVARRVIDDLRRWLPMTATGSYPSVGDRG